MKRDYKTKSEWKKAYYDKEKLLKEKYEEVTSFEFYRDLFPVGSFQDKGCLDQERPTGIVTTKVEEKCGVTFINISIMTDELDSLSFIYPKKKPKSEETKKLALIAPCGFYGKHKSKNMLHNLFAIVIDIDYVGLQQLKNLVKQFGNGSHAIPPTYIVSSGRGVHLYYLLEKPLPMYNYYEKVISELKKDLIRWTWNETSSLKPYDKDIAGVTQAFRAVGSETKLGFDIIAKAYKVTGTRYTVEQIKEWIGSDVDVNIDTYNREYRKKHIPLEEAKIKYPEWYKRRIIEGQPKQEAKWHCKRALYDWWIGKIKEEAKAGGRYYSIMALAAYGAKCDIPFEEIKKDAFALVEFLDSKTDDEANHFTRKDVQDALKHYESRNSNLTFKLTRNFISERTKIEIKPNKRRKKPLKRDDGTAFKAARIVQELQYPNGEWRYIPPTKEDIVKKWKLHHPDGKKSDCIRETGLSKPTVYKWWDGDGKKKEVTKEKEVEMIKLNVIDGEVFEIPLEEYLKLLELSNQPKQ